MKLSLLFFILCLSAQLFAAPLDKTKLKPPLPSNLWIEMSKVTQPGVVGVYLDIDLKKSHFKRDPFFDFIEEFLGQGFEYKRPKGSLENREQKPIGTGFIIDKQGHIITNYHVIEATQNARYQTKLQVQISGETQLHDAEVLGQDPRGDLALLKLTTPIKNLKPLELGDSDQLEVGEYVAAFGNPYGHSNSMTVGIISAKGRAIKELNRFPFIQTDASINPGNSGGPLLNTKGYVIGVNTAIDARAQGIGFAIPANYVKKIIGILKSGGTIQRAFLGIQLATLNPRVARSYGIKKRGIVVTGLTNNSPAEKVGIQPNDIIFEFNKRSFTDAGAFIALVQDSEVGVTYPIKVLRQAKNKFKELEFAITLTNFPDSKSSDNAQKLKNKHLSFQGQNAPYDLGFSISNSSSGARRHYNVPVDFPFSPIIAKVLPDSPAATAGLKKGNLILMVNGVEVNSATDVIKELLQGDNRLLIKSKISEKIISLKSE